MKKRPPTAEWSLSIDDQSSSWAGKLNNGHLTHCDLADANYTQEKHYKTNTTCYTKLQRCALAAGNFTARKQLFHVICFHVQHF